ncbi:hypothetical protein HYH03_003884 [Edaphochlamys debaryana]|uniref:Uncharacterized protein n=1 Tax=Edaphochlamys debaryana TaxID=47281 RepID=A0A835YC57_9CHLO|nr:hypothetical protein HYH03_003884 [Edaphochlamys debaryana]|eukprot:KAG2498126.1 hypothetical protein HYH03_003884 [Edaphochlamys debaryana]
MCCARCSSDVELGPHPLNRAYKVDDNQAVCMQCYIDDDDKSGLWHADCFTEFYRGDDYGDVEYRDEAEILARAEDLVEPDEDNRHVYDMTDVHEQFVRARTRKMVRRIVRRCYVDTCTASAILSLSWACNGIRDVLPKIITIVVLIARGLDNIWFGSAKYVYKSKGRGPDIDRDPADLDDTDIGNTVLLVKGRTCTVVASAVVQWTLEPGEELTAHTTSRMMRYLITQYVASFDEEEPSKAYVELLIDVLQKKPLRASVLADILRIKESQEAIAEANAEAICEGGDTDDLRLLLDAAAEASVLADILRMDRVKKAIRDEVHENLRLVLDAAAKASVLVDVLSAKRVPCVAAGYHRVLILEDDLVPTQALNDKRLAEAATFMRTDNEWEALSLGYTMFDGYDHQGLAYYVTAGTVLGGVSVAMRLVNVKDQAPHITPSRALGLFIVRSLHFSIMLFVSLYIFTFHRRYDVYYLLIMHIIILHWTLFKRECILAWLDELLQDPDYIMGSGYKRTAFIADICGHKAALLLGDGIVNTLAMVCIGVVLFRTVRAPGLIVADALLLLFFFHSNSLTA